MACVHADDDAIVVEWKSSCWIVLLDRVLAGCVTTIADEAPEGSEGAARS
jgi:hypothetical protein